MLKGDVIYTKLPSIGGSIQEGLRPCVVVSNNKGNIYSPVVIVVPLTTEIKKNYLPTHVEFTRINGKKNLALCEQIITINKTSVEGIGEHLDKSIMAKVDDAIKVSLGIRD